MAPVPTDVKYDAGAQQSADTASGAFDPKIPAGPSDSDKSGEVSSTGGSNGGHRKRCVVVGLGMVGIGFIEKLLKYDLEGGRDEWAVTVVGEEPHLAYNRVGLSTYWDKTSAEELYLNPLDWYKSHAPGKLTYHTQDPVVESK